MVQQAQIFSNLVFWCYEAKMHVHRTASSLIQTASHSDSPAISPSAPPPSPPPAPPPSPCPPTQPSTALPPAPIPRATAPGRARSSAAAPRLPPQCLAGAPRRARSGGHSAAQRASARVSSSAVGLLPVDAGEGEASDRARSCEAVLWIVGRAGSRSTVAAAVVGGGDVLGSCAAGERVDRPGTDVSRPCVGRLGMDRRPRNLQSRSSGELSVRASRERSSARRRCWMDLGFFAEPSWAPFVRGEAWPVSRNSRRASRCSRSRRVWWARVSRSAMVERCSAKVSGFVWVYWLSWLEVDRVRQHPLFRASLDAVVAQSRSKLVFSVQHVSV